VNDFFRPHLHQTRSASKADSSSGGMKLEDFMAEQREAALQLMELSQRNSQRHARLERAVEDLTHRRGTYRTSL
jgi:hypothetical protein